MGDFLKVGPILLRVGYGPEMVLKGCIKRKKHTLRIYDSLRPMNGVEVPHS